MTQGSFTLEDAQRWADERRSLFGDFAGDATVAFKLTGAPDGNVNVTLTIERGACAAAAKGAAKSADLTFSADHDLMVALLGCEADPAERYMSGELKVEGDMGLWFEMCASWHAAC